MPLPLNDYKGKNLVFTQLSNPFYVMTQPKCRHFYYVILMRESYLLKVMITHSNQILKKLQASSFQFGTYFSGEILLYTSKQVLEISI